MPTFQLSTMVVEDSVDYIQREGAGGALRLHGGNQPDADEAKTRPVLAEFRLPSPAFRDYDNEIIELRPTDPARALRGGRITWFSLVSHGGEVLCVGSADTSDADMILSRRVVQAGDTVLLDQFRYRVPRQ